MKTYLPRACRALTIVELLVMIGMVVLVALWVTPAARRLQAKRRLSRTIREAQALSGMLHELHAARLQAGQPGAFPTNSALTSTAFFVDCASTNMLGERFRFDMVDAPGVPACTSLVAKAFAPSNNAWCVTLGLTNGSPPDVPFLFTRNFAVKGKTNMLHLVDRMKADEQPFGDTMGLVVTFGGRVRVLRKEQIYSKEEFPEIFNPSGYRHSFLRP